jgi:proteasome lid subunit RPN8/RPN11
MSPENKALVLAHAVESTPLEACGLLIRTPQGEEQYVRIPNVAKHPERDFFMDPAKQAEVEDKGNEILAVCHSHPFKTPEPTEADLVYMERDTIPWYIVNPQTGEMQMYQPTGYRAPYEGRQFVHAILDCYSLIQDYFDWELSIKLPDFPRKEDWWKDKDGPDLYMEHFEEAGFRKVPFEDRPYENVRKHDVILMEVRSPFHRINHGAVYIGYMEGRGNNIALQQLYNQISGYVVYGGWWMKCTRLCVRHQSLI